MNERNWIDIEPGNYSLSAYEVSKKVIHLLRHSQKVQLEDDGAVQFSVFIARTRRRDARGFSLRGGFVCERVKEFRVSSLSSAAE